MKDTWATYKLSDVCEFQNGHAFRNQDYVEESEGELEIFRMGNIRRGGGYNPDAAKVFVPQKIAAPLKRFLLRRGDILMCMTDMKASMALLGHTALLPVSGKYLLNQRVGRIRVLQPGLLDSRYFYYYSNSPDYINHLRSRANSGVQVNLSTQEIRASPVICPPLSTQRKIAGVLSAYDDLTENNARQIAILEEMAQAIYREWFIYFRFPGHDKVRLTDSPLGKIPEGWNVEPLGAVSDLQWGDTNTTKAEYVEEGYTAYSAAGGDGFLDHFDFDRTGIVLSAIGANCGGTWYVVGKWSCIKNTIRFWATRQSPSTEYLYLTTNEIEFWPRRGAAQPFISQQDARQKAILVPHPHVEQNFAKVARDLLLGISTLRRKNNTLRKTRELLLPKLISGQLDVEELDIETGEPLVEAVA